jgi:hypothetical protein
VGQGACFVRNKMSMEEDMSDDGTVEQKVNSQSTEIEHFHARRFKAKAEQSAEKRVILKVTGTGSNKKQKTLIKEHMKEALKDWMEIVDLSCGESAEGDDHMELQEGGVSNDAMSPSAGPSHLTGTLEEAR